MELGLEFWENLRLGYEVTNCIQHTTDIFIQTVWNEFQEVDLACAPLGISIQRYEAMEFCGYLDGTTTSILIQYPTFDIMSYFGTLKTFSYQVFLN
jgi:hypothetical protein